MGFNDRDKHVSDLYIIIDRSPAVMRILMLRISDGA